MSSTENSPKCPCSDRHQLFLGPDLESFEPTSVLLTTEDAPGERQPSRVSLSRVYLPQILSNPPPGRTVSSQGYARVTRPLWPLPDFCSHPRQPISAGSSSPLALLSGEPLRVPGHLPLCSHLHTQRSSGSPSVQKEAVLFRKTPRMLLTLPTCHPTGTQARMAGQCST